MKPDLIKALLKARGCRLELVAAGWAGLVEAWRSIVDSIQSGYRLTADDYLNDMDVRQIIEEALPMVSPLERAEIEQLDALARAHLVSVSKCLWGGATAKRKGWTAKGNWWYFSVPRSGLK